MWYQLSLAEIARKLDTNLEQGLSHQEAEKKRAVFGFNELPQGKKLRWWRLMLRQFNNPMIYILLIAAAITLWLKEFIDFYVITLAVIVNVVIGFWQEFRSSRIFEQLRSLVAIRTLVKRDGKIFEIDSKNLVPGDIIILKGSAKVPADGRLISARKLTVDEALLTGESAAVDKKAKDMSGTVAIGDRVNMVHTGTIVEKGEGVAVVVATGLKTELGEIARLTASVGEETTPLQERLRYLGRKLAIYVTIISIIIFVLGSLEGKGFVQMFTVTVAIIVAAIPEGLPAALAVVLAVSVQRILRRNGLVKKLIGAETLGSASIIVTDKTGTLTEGKMEVEQLIGVRDTRRAALVMALANEAIVEEGGEKQIRGEETDRAKIRFFLESGGDIRSALHEYKREALLPFNQIKKYVASFHTASDGNSFVFVTGAPEMLVSISKIPRTQKEKILKDVEQNASRGFRMIGIAERTLPREQKVDWDDDAALDNMIYDLSFVGLAVIRDPIRDDVKESVFMTRKAGIQIVMATGDHRLTALTIGKELGFSGKPDSVVSGEELERMSDEEFLKRIGEIEIYSRVSPSHKMRIVNALREKGEVVAMTGDGVNDAPALKAADIGISLASGTDVTKETADLVLLDNSFSVITEAIRQGRIAFDNIRKVTVFLFTNSFTEIILVLSALLFRIPLPVSAVQILWANFVEDGFPNFALAFEPGEKDIMRRKPLRRNEPILNKQSLIIIFIVGIISDLLMVAIYLYLYYYTDFSFQYIRTIMFSMLATDALVYVFSIKSLGRSILRTNVLDNVYLLFAVFFGFLVMAASIYVPTLQRLLSTVSLSLPAILFVLGKGLLLVTLIELVKWFFYRKNTFQLAADKQMC
ncbi:MAG: hypothetical protein A3C80_03775 [Candidatus Ryanbacteria bacterium RIFCSPHIGHO2_02_FULL_45_43]|uniref:Cation-transporting P-type ATPase N-terminal domain-containing protein n=1 Tax=Candidatus Ryanbacteria bacterium RIFCSPHIGHO2_01_45_13 TaxID=1802112 RepID=A0A1G2FYJ6_9BACT|nr:MAG: hypothetical protein A2718_03035 [Candidatus Ryanbacteria bacterium RIFCSPHIGHO2_01_FULL_44_130]OGZ43129.1 MAG: hypothetical protein A2W41_00340 [Candidatus Ryanbacteria bacterium RIFCSPHIGHO2_01_45_13]OGZ47796.1 MAG: hypothetical protein A3C80_03775 [Candidatus Ryanbacteria bacterium RIFCSPHIGHO2_02_FULL_45_43]OGZ49689.1 MAG: hypothetical protein A3E55_02230 [Candidatus Ryanbacteria bacterium RIFCSPHIGHO2_12_FULL_44_20]OGZ52182.1 MAG: hypothetical protein A3A17_03095 [Candidatus Ryanba